MNTRPWTGLALFDLDHTLAPFDTGMAWTQHLIAHGELAPHHADDYLAACQAYVAGTLDILALHRQMVGAIAGHPRARLDALRATLAQALRPRIPQATLDTVAAHRAAGHACLIVTATTRYVAEGFAPLFGIDTLLATEAAVDAQGRWTGEVAGAPCFRAGKLDHVGRWLQAHGLSLATAGPSWFYSDSASDLPLLEAVDHPVAVRPDARLAAVAAARGWAVRSLDDRDVEPPPGLAVPLARQRP